MPDITKCQNEYCPQKETCWRWTSPPDRLQSYSFFDFNEEDGCEFYWDINSKVSNS
jgi:hypothetical protein